MTDPLLTAPARELVIRVQADALEDPGGLAAFERLLDGLLERTGARAGCLAECPSGPDHLRALAGNAALVALPEVASALHGEGWRADAVLLASGATLRVHRLAHRGAAVGALCLVDPGAFHPNDDDTALLLDTAARMVRARRAHLRQNRIETLLHRSQEGGRMGVWQVELATGTLSWSEGTFRIMGLDPATFTPTVENYLAHVHPHDRDDVRAAWERALAATSDLDQELFHRVVRADTGEVRQILLRGRVATEGTGRGVWLAGIVQDLTEERAAEARLQELRVALEQSIDGMALADLDGTLRTVNAACARMHGWRVDELEGRTLGVLHTPEQMAGEVATLLAELARDGAWSGEVHHVRRDGTEFPVRMHSTVIRAPDGTPTGLFAVMRDRTEERRAEDQRRTLAAVQAAAARVSARLFGLTVAGVDSGVFAAAVAEGLERVTRALGADMAWLLPWGDAAVPPVVATASGAPAPPGIEAFARALAGGDLPWVSAQLARGAPLHLPDPASLPREATAEAELLARLPVHGLLLAPVSASKRGRAGVLAFATRAAPRVWSSAEVRTLRLFADTLAGVLAQRASNAALNEAFQRLERIAEHVPGVIYQFRMRPDGSSHFPYASSGIRQIYGVDPDEVRDDAGPVFGALHPDDIDDITRSIVRSADTLEEWHQEYRVRFSDGRVIWVEGHASPEREPDGAVLWHGYIRDVTERVTAEQEREQLQTQLHQVQRLESVGRLAGGVAHDFNNMLTVILGHVEIAMEELAPDDPHRATFAAIAEAAERSAAITRQLLGFARRQEVSPAPLELSRAVAGTLEVLRALIGEDIRLVWDPAPAPLLIAIDPAQLDQILTNLCVNARDATGPGGTVRVATGVAAVDAADVPERPGAAPEGYAVLRVTDDGHGMDAATLARVFDPFFTTKPVGRGTGLGLSTVHGIVKQNGGFVEVESARGRGTTFSVHLPLRPAGHETP